jgi:hypothetical protein
MAGSAGNIGLFGPATLSGMAKESLNVFDNATRCDLQERP